MSEHTLSANSNRDAANNRIVTQLFQTPANRFVLDNGLTLLHRPDFSSAVVSVQVWVKTGSIHENGLLGSGLSHFLEHMLFKGTARREGKAISREVHALGGSVNAYTSFDRTVYYVDGPSTAFREIADLLADIVFHSTLPEDELAREREVILREIDMGRDDPDQQLSQALFRTAFQRHPFREPVIGHRELFERVTASELRAYYEARYVPNNMVVSVVGKVDEQTCLEAVAATFGDVPRGRLAPVHTTAEPVQLSARRDDRVGDYHIRRGSLCFKVPNLSHPDAPILDVLANALGGGESSLLWERIRNDRKLVHYIDCRNWNPGEKGLFWISYVSDPEKGSAAEEAIQEILSEVAAAGLDRKFLAKACNQALSAEINGRKTMSGQATRLAVGEAVVGDLQYGRQYLRRLQGVKTEDLSRVAAEHLVPENLSVVTLGPQPCGESAEGPSAEPSAVPFEQLEFQNGARLLLQPDKRLPKVHLRAVLRGGAFYESAKERGVSALMAELLTKDTASRSAREVAESIEMIGGSFSATTGNNTVSLSIEVLPDDVWLALELLKDALTQPCFEANTFEREREAQIADLREEEDEILDYGFRVLREHFFGDHPFSVGADGRIADLEQLPHSAVRSQYEKLVCSGNLVLAVCGDFERAAFLEQVRPLLETDLKQGGLESRDFPFDSNRKGATHHLPMDREQAVLLEGYPGAGLLDDDFVVSDVMNELFSGMSSRLFERVRDDLGLAYYVGSTRVIGPKCGMFVFYAGTHPRHVATVQKEIANEIERIKAGQIGAGELERCRVRLRAIRTMGRQTPGSRAMQAALNATYGLPIDDDVAYARKLEEVTVEALSQFATRRLDAAHRVRLTVGSKLNQSE